MIRKLKRNFILSATAAFAMVSIFLISLILLSQYLNFKTRVDVTMDYVVNSGKDPYKSNLIQQFGPEAPSVVRYFAVTETGRDKVKNLFIELKQVESIDEKTIKSFASRALKGSRDGWINYYKYKITETDESNKVVFVDFQREIIQLNNLLLTIVISGIVVNLLVFLVMVKLSERVISPLVDNLNRQKQFISDASHEIKTPLAIISANTDVMEISNGKSEWIDSNRRQVQRLDKLVNQMLTLSKYEQEDEVIVFDKVNIRYLLEDILEEYKILLEDKKMKVYSKIENLYIETNKDILRQIVYVLLDNALKYTNDEKILEIRTSTTGISLANSTDPIAEKNLDKLFERFYRVEKSRSREKGGNGIGLSIAQELANKIDAILSVRMINKNMIEFSIKFF